MAIPENERRGRDASSRRYLEGYADTGAARATVVILVIALFAWLIWSIGAPGPSSAPTAATTSATGPGTARETPATPPKQEALPARRG